MRVMRGKGLAGGSAETSLATARPFSSPRGSVVRKVAPAESQGGFDETVRSRRADTRLGLGRPGRAILASHGLVASAASWRLLLLLREVVLFMRWLCHWQHHCIALCLASSKDALADQKRGKGGAAKKQGEGGGGRRWQGARHL